MIKCYLKGVMQLAELKNENIFYKLKFCGKLRIGNEFAIMFTLLAAPIEFKG
jgi:hypothetical protein